MVILMAMYYRLV